MKKTDAVPVHKKRDKQILKNYQAVSLLPICGKQHSNSISNPEAFRNIFGYYTGFSRTLENYTHSGL